MRAAWTLGFLLILLSFLSAAVAAGQDDAGVQPVSHSDAYWYGRFGYGAIAAEGRYAGPSFGFGRRFERDTIGLDLLLLGVQAKIFGTSPDLHTIGGIYTHAHAASLLTVTGLYFLRPTSRTTVYVGGGGGWGTVSFGRTGDVYEDWHSAGFESAVTIGYALARADTSTRLFVQADLVRPFGRVARFNRAGEVVGDRRVSVAVVSLGAGW